MKKFLLSLLVTLIGVTSFAQKEAPEDSTILKMVESAKKDNFLGKDGKIFPGQLLLWKFEDNKFFEFYEIVKPGENLWVIAKRLLIVTSDYHKNSKSLLALPKKEQTVPFDKEAESLSAVALPQKPKYGEPTALQKILYSIVVPFLFMFFCIKIHNIFNKKKRET